MAVGAGLFVPIGQIAEDHHRLAVERNPGGLKHWLAFARDLAAGLLAAASLVPGARVASLGVCALHQMNDELAFRIARQGEGLRPESLPLHFVAIKGANIRSEEHTSELQ